MRVGEVVNVFVEVAVDVRDCDDDEVEKEVIVFDKELVPVSADEDVTEKVEIGVVPRV